MSHADGLRVQIRAADPVRRTGLTALLRAAGHHVVDDLPDVTLCDIGEQSPESEAPTVLLTQDGIAPGNPAGALLSDATPEQLDLALRAVAAGLLVRSNGLSPERGFGALTDDAPLLTPREREILSLVGKGMSNKTVARHLGISVHTVKFHLEALFAKLGATSRAEAVAKGLMGGAIAL